MYQDHLEDSEFVKYGIVISSLVWNKTYSDIADAFNVSKPYVSQVLKRWNSDGKFTDRRKNNGGSNKKLTPDQEQSMIDLIEEDRSTSLRSLASEIGNCSKTTVWDSLKALGFIKTLPLKVPLLSTNAVEKRLEYATRHLEDKFSNVCFTDESIFQLSENRKLYWWNPHSEDRPVFEDNHKKSKIMIWGGISRKGVTDIYFWKISKDLTVDAFEYTKCLNEALIDRMDTLHGKKKWRLMHDNARPHTAEHTQDFLIENDIRALDHPPSSPDLNPIELVWAYLKDKVMCKVYNDLDQVLEKIVEEWGKISIKMLNNLIDGHCARVGEIYRLNGTFL